MNSSLDTGGIWWQEENYRQSGNRNGPFTYWLDRNSYWLKLALVGTLVAAAWLMIIVKVFLIEIRDIYSSSKAYLRRTFSSWRKTICREKRRRTRYFGPRFLQKGHQSQVRLEMGRLRVDKPTILEPKKSKHRDYQHQNIPKRRTLIKIVDDIYGEIVGYEDTGGPRLQSKENTVVREQKVVPGNSRTIRVYHDNNRTTIGSNGYVGLQPRCHGAGGIFKTLNEENTVAERSRLTNEAYNRSCVNTRRTEKAISSTMSPPTSRITPEIIRMGEISYCIKRGRSYAYKATTSTSMAATAEQYEDLKETRV